MDTLLVQPTGLKDTLRKAKIVYNFGLSECCRVLMNQNIHVVCIIRTSNFININMPSCQNLNFRNVLSFCPDLNIG